jgi:RNA polymerase sigma factor (TIGR02999 family)
MTRNPGDAGPAPFLDEYRELRSIAAKHLRRHPAGTTWQATALVHEVYLKLARGSGIYADRKHFLCTAAAAMRQILLDRARYRRRLKRGAGVLHVTLDGREVAAPGEGVDGVDGVDSVDVLIVDQLIGRLAALDARQAQIVELRFFVGLNVQEVAELLGLSDRSVKREWAMAKAWLQRELTATPALEGPA